MRLVRQNVFIILSLGVSAALLTASLEAGEVQAIPPKAEPPNLKMVEYGGGVSVIPDERTVVLKGHTCVATNERPNPIPDICPVEYLSA